VLRILSSTLRPSTYTGHPAPRPVASLDGIPVKDPIWQDFEDDVCSAWLPMPSIILGFGIISTKARDTTSPLAQGQRKEQQERAQTTGLAHPCSSTRASSRSLEAMLTGSAKPGLLFLPISLTHISLEHSSLMQFRVLTKPRSLARGHRWPTGRWMSIAVTVHRESWLGPQDTNREFAI